ncbi:TPA: hypothetical protein N0F65_005190 [Lagenidium giganteum]|uniref:Temptin Cys/Cys disulfide domain-containing protein n=1 Tax=Lagenidium giganteum TaxID=4803 RepID=A0AAV2Z0T7_9STRA|nr:TPA: hypothetical protein N0F65_005190 [Lagenidium giganteum]
MNMYIVASVVASAVVQVAAHDEYVKLIPNGNNVKGVKAVGHVNPKGDGDRNSFGTAFGKAKLKWKTSLCQADSDGDGQTNGEELGDPCCVWAQGKDNLLQRTSGLSNPGDPKSTSDATAAGFKCENGSNATAVSTTAAPSTNAAGGGYRYIIAIVFGVVGVTVAFTM